MYIVYVRIEYTLQKGYLLICTLYLCISKYSEKLKQVLVPTILGRNVYGYGLASKLLPTAIITYVLYYVPVPRYLLLM